MVGVFLAFATSDVATVRQLGVGLALAIAIDATVVRLILLPYALRAGGRFTWWLPSWLENCLPALDIGTDRRRNNRPWEAPTVRAPVPVPVTGLPLRGGATREEAGAAIPAVHAVPAAPRLLDSVQRPSLVLGDAQG